MTDSSSGTPTTEPDPTIREIALAALEARERVAAHRREQLQAERAEREEKEHRERVRRCRPILTDVLGPGWVDVKSGDAGLKVDCWVTFVPGDDSVDVTLVVGSDGTVAEAEYRASGGREPHWGKRIKSLADLGQLIEDRQRREESIATESPLTGD